MVVCDIRQELVDEFKEKVSKTYPERTLAVNCDITKDAALDELFGQARSTFGQMDFLVNCAGRDMGQ